jgi:hypothetical protein
MKFTSRNIEPAAVNVDVATLELVLVDVVLVVAIKVDAEDELLLLAVVVWGVVEEVKIGPVVVDPR